MFGNVIGNLRAVSGLILAPLAGQRTPPDPHVTRHKETDLPEGAYGSWVSLASTAQVFDYRSSTAC